MKRWAALLAFLLGAVLAGLAPIWVALQAARGEVERRDRERTKEVSVTGDSLSTSWINAKGRTETVTTVRAAGETDPELEERHDARVAARIAKVGEQPPPQQEGS